MPLSKRVYTTTKKVFIYGSGTFLAFFTLLLSLSYLGINISTSGDISCGSTCISYFNISLQDYSLCFGSTFKGVSFDKDVTYELYKADLRYRTDNPARWKPYNFSAGKCLDRGKNYEFMLVGHKEPYETVKWGVSYSLKEADPYWLGVENLTNISGQLSSYSNNAWEFYDGDWSTNTYTTPDGNFEIVFNYSIPDNINKSGTSLWMVKDGMATINLTLPQTCLDKYPLTLSLRVVSGNLDGDRNWWYCYDGSWVELRACTAGDNSCRLLYEERIFWNATFPITTTLYLNGISADRKYELGTTANVSASAIYTSDGSICPSCQVCISLDAPSYGANYSCANGQISFNYSINAARNNKFWSDQIIKRINFTADNATYTYHKEVQLVDYADLYPAYIGWMFGGFRRVWIYPSFKTNYFVNMTAYFTFAQVDRHHNISVELCELDTQYAIVCDRSVKRLFYNLSELMNVVKIFNFSVDTNPNKYLGIRFYMDDNNSGIENFIDDGTSPYAELRFKASETGYPFKYTEIWTGAWNTSYGAAINMTYRTSKYFDYIAFHGSSVFDSYTYNTTGIFDYNWPKDVKIDYGNDGQWDKELSGELRGNQLYLYEFSNGNIKEILEYAGAGSKIRYIKVPVNSTIINGTLTGEGAYGTATIVEAVDTNTIWGSTIKIGQSFKLTKNYTLTSFSYYVSGLSTAVTCGILNMTNNKSVVETTATDIAVSYWRSCDFTDTYFVNGTYMLYINTTGENRGSGIDTYADGHQYLWHPLSTWWSAWLGPDLAFRVYAITYPANLTVDVGLDGFKEFARMGELNQTQFIIYLNKTSLQSFTNQSEFCDITLCTIPIRFSLEKGGNLNLSNINVSSTNFNPLLINQSLIRKIVENASGWSNITIAYTVAKNGTVSLSGQQFDYKGNANHTITANYYGNATYSASSDSQSLQIKYSRFNISLPLGTDWLQYFASTTNSKNVTPYRQSSSMAIWNITSLSYDEPFNVSVKYNHSINSCLNITMRNQSIKDGLIVSISSQQICSNIGTGQRCSVWHWADLYNCTVRYVFPIYKVSAICTQCVKTFDWDESGEVV